MDDVFHRGERALQARAGVRARLHAIGPQIIRDALPDAHRAFFEQLPMLFVGTLDAAGIPWASVVAGAPGFAHAPDEYFVIESTQAKVAGLDGAVNSYVTYLETLGA